MRRVLASVSEKLRRYAIFRMLFSRLPLTVKVRLRNLFRPAAIQYVLTSTDHAVMILLEQARTLSRDSVSWQQETVTVDWDPEPFWRQIASFPDAPATIPDSGEFGLVSVDFWDTIVARLRPAESAKRCSSLRTSFLIWSNSGFRSRRLLAAEIHDARLQIEDTVSSRAGEVQLHDVLEGFRKKFGLNTRELELLHRAEIEDEIRYTRPINTMCNVLDLESSWIVSDFYIGCDGLAKISRAHGLEIDKSRMLVSSDHGKTKRSNGELFRLLPNFGLHEWLHIGDNAWADVECVTNLGGTAIHVPKVGRNSWNSHSATLEELAHDLPSHLGQSESGTMLVHGASVAFGLVTYAIETAAQNGLDQVVYLSREGETLHQAHQIIARQVAGMGGPHVESRHLPVSRTSTFGPSNALNLGQAMKVIAKQYPHITANGLVTTLGLPDAISRKVRCHFGGLQDVPTSEIVQRLDSALLTEINEYLLHQRELVMALLKDLNVSPDNSLLADLGWRGSIQDSLSRIAGKDFSGAYLGLRTPFWHLGSSHKRGLVFDEPVGRTAPEFLDFVGHLERFFTVSDSQVVSLRETPEGIKVVRSRHADGPSRGRRELMETHWGRAVEEVSECWLSAGAFGVEAEPMVRHVLMQWSVNPNALQASCWFDEAHDEPFGVGSMHDQRTLKPSESWLGAGGLREITRSVRSSVWAAGDLCWLPIRSFIDQGEDSNVGK